MTCCFVSVDNAMADRLVEDRDGGVVGSICTFVVTGIDSGNGFFDRGAHGRSLAGVMPSPGFSLSCPLSCLGCICH